MGIRVSNFWPGVGVDSKIFGHKEPENSAEGAILESFCIFPEKLFLKNRIFRTDPFLCSDVKKISDFRPDVKNLHFSVQTLNFVLKRSVIGLIMHKNAIKHENIGFRGVFRRRRRRKKFSTP